MKPSTSALLAYFRTRRARMAVVSHGQPAALRSGIARMIRRGRAA